MSGYGPGLPAVPDRRRRDIVMPVEKVFAHNYMRETGLGCADKSEISIA